MAPKAGFSTAEISLPIYTKQQNTMFLDLLDQNLSTVDSPPNDQDLESLLQRKLSGAPKDHFPPLTLSDIKNQTYAATHLPQYRPPPSLTPKLPKANKNLAYHQTSISPSSSPTAHR